MDSIFHDYLPERLGKRIKVQINGQYINVSALARFTGLNQSYLSKVLGGKINPTKANLKIIAEAMDMSIGQLIDAIDIRITA